MNYDIPEWLTRDTYRRRRERYAKQREAFIRNAVVGAIIVTAAIAVLLQPYTITYEAPQQELPDPCELATVTCEGEDGGVHLETQTAYAFVTGYNTVPEQTDSTPCIAASGDDICGRTDVVACPRALPLGTRVEIDGTEYVCLDRLAEKYDHRYDISCDKDRSCPAEVTGYKEVKIKQ